MRKILKKIGLLGFIALTGTLSRDMSNNRVWDLWNYKKKVTFYRDSEGTIFYMTTVGYHNVQHLEHERLKGGIHFLRVMRWLMSEEGQENS